MIQKINDHLQKSKITRTILEALPDWFGMEDSREEYIEKSKDSPYFAAYEENKVVGFLYLKETGKDTVELYVMGILKECHRKGYGQQLFNYGKEYAIQHKYSFIQVKTVVMGKYKEYDATNNFYLSLGFKELEVFPTLWDEWNPCQIYIIAL